MVHIAGTLSFTRAKDTRLDVGLIKIGGDTSEDGFNCLHGNLNPRPALEVGAADDPIPAGRKALIRLVYFDGLDKETFPSIVCCGGRMDLHGAELSRTWVKLGAPATKGDTEIALSEPVTILNGNDNFLLESYLLGAEGALLGFGTLAAREQVDMHHAVRAGDLGRARELADMLQPLCDAIFAAPVRDYRARLKHALARLDVIESAHVRPPLLPLSDDDRHLVDRALKAAGLL